MFSTASNRPIRVDLTHDFLEHRGWHVVKEGTRFVLYHPPASLDLPNFELTLPTSSGADSSQSQLVGIVGTLAEIYDFSYDQLRVALAEPDIVASIQLDGEQFKYGSVPFLQFEAVVDRLRKMLLDMAAFVLTDEPQVDTIPGEAEVYLKECRFLQTERGSYVTKIQLPAARHLADPTLFRPEPVTSDNVNTKVADVIGFVADNIYRSNPNIYDDDFVNASGEFINIDVFRDIYDLYVRSESEHVNFSFLGARFQREVRSGPLTHEKHERFAEYIRFAEDKFAAEVPVDMVGRIVELRSRRRDRRRNYVGITGVNNGREAFVSLALRPQDYVYAVQAHQHNQRVHVVGRARRMRTQLRITHLDYFVAIDTEQE